MGNTRTQDGNRVDEGVNAGTVITAMGIIELGKK